MVDITEYESRITAALDRITKGLEGLEPPQPVQAGPSPEAEAEIARLTQALEDERTANAELEGRAKEIKDTLENRVSGMEAALEEARASVAAVDTELQQLREVNEKLRESNVALRDANAEGLADAELINASLMAEVEALRAGREADAAEMGAVLTQLDAILATAETKEEDA